MTERVHDARQRDQSQREKTYAVPAPVHPCDRCQCGTDRGAREVDRHINGVEAAARRGDEAEDPRLVRYLRHLRTHIEHNNTYDERYQMEDRGTMRRLFRPEQKIRCCQ